MGKAEDMVEAPTTVLAVYMYQINFTRSWINFGPIICVSMPRQVLSPELLVILRAARVARVQQFAESHERTTHP